ncbi:hypothetical protein PpBr36_04948 [Pyricularia pennisetigena]|uniref:hypothetical protein n=1 Tax=Pyricularia pennisetigena TaxID=1578925 RepID=UPI001151DC77|nr:hypothetical protein PpBr36_04948 [Pyricularia pennisetigena]TLS27046.1 hypothetical protein PpBr36_04948 [Pyricularia pennisetigena]
MSEPKATTPWIPVDRSWSLASNSPTTSNNSDNPSSYSLNRWLNEPKKDSPFNTLHMVRQGPSQSTATGAGGNSPSSTGAANGSSHEAT